MMEPNHEHFDHLHSEGPSLPAGSRFPAAFERVRFTPLDNSQSTRQWLSCSDAQLVGYLSKPDSATPPKTNKVIVYVGGSEGGVDATLADYFARHGLVAFVIGYHKGTFGADQIFQNLPDDLARINLDNLGAAIDWFRNQPNVKDRELILCGASRGGELSLILASLFPELFSKVVALAPSTRVIAPHSADSERNSNYIATETPAWVRNDGSPYWGEGWPPVETDGEWPPYVQGAIPVQKIQAPILAVSWADDEIWGSFSSDIKDSTTKKRIDSSFTASSVLAGRSNSKDQKLVVPGKGHSIYPAELVDSPKRSQPIQEAWNTIIQFISS